MDQVLELEADDAIFDVSDAGNVGRALHVQARLGETKQATCGCYSHMPSNTSCSSKS